MTDADRTTQIFEAEREVLVAVAYRMLGEIEAAQDVVQDAYLRWRTTDTAEIRDPRGWLVTVTTRLAMDALRSARVQRTAYVGPWLPEPLVEGHAPPADERALVDETVSVGLLVALERCSPAERASFLLHDVFQYSFAEVSSILGRTEAACRQLATRGRNHIAAERPRFPVEREQHRALLETFLEAARTGDLERMETLVADAVVLHTDGGGKASAARSLVRGASAVCRFLGRVWRDPERTRLEASWSTFNGAPGLLLREEGTLIAAVTVRIADGRIDGIFAHRNPDKLARFGGDSG